MKYLKKILIAIVVASTITLCACKKKNIEKNLEKIENNTFLSTENLRSKNQKSRFQKTLSLQNITFYIETFRNKSINQLTIKPKGLEINNEKIILELEGQVTNAEIEDLNSDGFPEILIYTVSIGSGSYGNVIGYSVNNGKSISQIYFPEISENKTAEIGYMGHDEFTIIETSLARRFPIYKEGDTNNKPTGGTRQIEYKLKDGEASKLFVINKISEY